MDTQEVKIILEAALLTSQTPLSVKALRQLFSDDAVNAETIRESLEVLRQDWSDRGLVLVDTAAGWRFQSAALLRPYLERMNPEKAPRYSRAVLETLAIVAYRQPVTRGDIEEIRGVTVSSSVLKTLEERGWVETIGHREAPGRPALLATTRTFLTDLGLRSLDELPSLDGNSVVPEEFELQFGSAEQKDSGSAEQASPQLSLEEAIEQTSDQAMPEMEGKEVNHEVLDEEIISDEAIEPAAAAEEGCADTETHAPVDSEQVSEGHLEDAPQEDQPTSALEQSSDAPLEDDSSQTEPAAAA